MYRKRLWMVAGICLGIVLWLPMAAAGKKGVSRGDDSGATGGSVPTTPYVGITSPIVYEVFQINTPINLVGSVSDYVDGFNTLDLVWSSSVEGNLGIGYDIHVELSTVGSQLIAAEATNSRGYSGRRAYWIHLVDTQGYCLSKSHYQIDDSIYEVSVDSFTNLSGGFAGYSDYTNELPAIDLFRGKASKLTLERSFWDTAYGENWRVWLDYNQNKVFEDHEVIFSGVTPPDIYAFYPVTGSFTVPADAPTGTTRMRVSMKRGEYAGPCETFSYGEVEDYLVHIQ